MRFAVRIAVAMALGFALIFGGTSPNNAAYTCDDGGVTIYDYVTDFAIGRYAPCKFLVRLMDAGRVWAVEGNLRVPLVITAVNDGCEITPGVNLEPRRYGWTIAGKVRVIDAPCHVIIAPNVDAPGLRWFAYWRDIQRTRGDR